ncbi:enteropeptidase-like [Ptychodera flava]|uniref:enteropeptidase-like n=1 Tax=Ptychodera flava TaxID=63121 RepID=UPI003969EF62
MEVKFTTFSREDRQTVITSEGSSTSQDQFDYKGFKAVYTIFYKVESGSEECNIGDFKCDNGWCIAQWLTCDGYKNCEDGSDEYGCTTVQNHSSFLGVIVGLTVAIIFGIVSYVLLVTVSKKRGYKCLGIRGQANEPGPIHATEAAKKLGTGTYRCRLCHLYTLSMVHRRRTMKFLSIWCMPSTT